MVIFTSQCEKKALSKTRRVLDSFADRIGDRTWKTIITLEGLDAVHKLLRKTASKNTAVSCHWIRSRSLSELVWVVGNRSKFNEEGVIPVNSTQKNILGSLKENNWHYLPVIKALSAFVGLIHDWGKANDFFQCKLRSTNLISDPVRHEWVSAIIFRALIKGNENNDEAWLKKIIDKAWTNEELNNQIVTETDKGYINLIEESESNSVLANWILYLVFTHHKLPYLTDRSIFNQISEEKIPTIHELYSKLDVSWGYLNNIKEAKKCFDFSKGFLEKSVRFKEELSKCANSLLEVLPLINDIQEKKLWRLIINYSRICIILGDHFISSKNEPLKISDTENAELYANTNKEKNLKQPLVNHLIEVSKQSKKISRYLPRFEYGLESAQEIKKLKAKSPPDFKWQDIAVDTVKKHQKNETINNWFIINMASTGQGKTIANAKIFHVLSQGGQSLRFTLALGLRTLTQQTGEVYSKKIGVSNQDLAVVMGTNVFTLLSKHNDNEVNEYTKFGSESEESLLGHMYISDDDQSYSIPDFLDFSLTNNKEKSFLLKPIVICTIDHIINASEVVKGGRFILPSLRLMSSDLIIDEVDDFDTRDLVAIGRLIHLAGMYGRKVMISSATIPPSLARGYFEMYKSGWEIYKNFKDIKCETLNVVWVDEFDTKVENIILKEPEFESNHKDFVNNRLEKLKNKPVLQKAELIKCNHLINEENKLEKYFQLILENIKSFHENHNSKFEIYGATKNISFGLIRLANINECVALSRYIIESEQNDEIEIRTVCYHSRQIQILRHELETYLDRILNRKRVNGKCAWEDDLVINEIVKQTEKKNIVFLVVSSPIEEVGRDHDFDWAIIEPSSIRSIIQLSGRVNRHRKDKILTPNVGILQLNIKALKGNQDSIVFVRPGYQTERLASHELDQLINFENFRCSIDSTERINQRNCLDPFSNLSDLEHYVISNKLIDDIGFRGLSSWAIDMWYLTALPQKANRFRENSGEDIKLYRILDDEEGKFNWEEFGLIRNYFYDIKDYPINNHEKFWLKRELKKSINSIPLSLKYEKIFYEILLPSYMNVSELVYSDNYGLFEKVE